jgi:Holliday junction resolvase RusA-like endonuclease
MIWDAHVEPIAKPVDEEGRQDFEAELESITAQAMPESQRIHEVGDPYPVVRFKVGGQAATQGSKTTGTMKSGIRYTRESNKRLPQWRTDVASAAGHAMGDHDLLTGPLELEAVFVFPRPKSHYTSKGALTKSAAPQTAPTSHQMGDTSKLIRAIEDAMQKIVYLDDSQITTISARKRWGVAAATYVTVRPDPVQG